MSSRRTDRNARLFLAITIAFLALVVFTFARTYYLKPLFGTPPLPLRLHIHGVVMTGWIVLLGIQLALVQAGRVAFHRRLGVLGGIWAVAVIVVGSSTTVAAARREIQEATPFAGLQVTVTELELLQMLCFAAFVGAALFLRSRPDWHGRLMLLTLASLLPSALARFPVGFPSNARILLGLDGFLVVCVLLDAAVTRRLHPALGYGALAFAGIFHVALWLFQQPHSIALGMGLFG